jgi:hypothetical protein
MNKQASVVRRILKTGAVSMLVLMLLCTIVAVEAQTPDNGAGSANIIAQNMHDTSGASVVAAYLDPDGTPADSLGTSVAPRSAKEFLATDASLGAPWIGSMVLYSDQELASVANVLYDGGSTSKDGTCAASYAGFAETSDTFYLPRVMVVHGNKVGHIAIQNADDTEATVWVRYYKLGEATPTATISDTIEVGGSRHYDLGDPGGKVPDLAALAGESTWSGSAVVEADDGKQITAVYVNHWRGYCGAYVGATEPSQTLVAPKVARRAVDDGGTLKWLEFAMIALQNPGSSTATVDVAFYDRLSGTQDLLLDDLTIPGMQTIIIHLRLGQDVPASALDPLDRDPGPDSIWNGKVVATSDVPIFGVAAPIRRGVAASMYNMIDPAEGSGVLYMPSASRVRSGAKWQLYSRLAVANLSASEASVDYYFYGRDGNLDLSLLDQTIPGNGVENLLLKNLAGLGTDWLGSVYAESDQDVLCIVDTLWNVNGRLSSYNAIND